MKTIIRTLIQTFFKIILLKSLFHNLTIIFMIQFCHDTGMTATLQTS